MQPDREHLASIMHRTYSINKPHSIITTPDKLVNRNVIIKHQIQSLEAYTTFPPRMNQHHKMPAMKILLLIHDGNERKQKAKYYKVQEVNVLDFLISQNNQLTYNNKDYIIEQIKTIYEKLIIENLESSKQLQNFQQILVSENKQIQQSLIINQGKIKQLSKQVIQYFQLQQGKQTTRDTDLCQLQKKAIQRKNLSKNIYKQPNKFQQLNKNEIRNGNNKKDTNKKFYNSTAENITIKNQQLKVQQKLDGLKYFLKQNQQFLQGNLQTKEYIQLFCVFIEKKNLSQHKNKIKNWQSNFIVFKKQFYRIEKSIQNIQQLTQFRKSFNNVQMKVSSEEFINSLNFLNKKISKINQKMLKTLKDLINRVENIKDDMNNKLKIMDNLDYEGNQYFENIVYFIDYFKLRDQLKNKIKQGKWNKQNLQAITLVYSLNHNIQQCQNRLKFFQDVFGIIFGGHYKNLFKKRNTIYYKSSFEYFKESNTSDEQSSLSSDNIDEEQSELNLCEKKVKRHILPKSNLIFRILNKKQNKISYKEMKNNQIINQYNSETQEEEDLNFSIWQSPLYKQQA